MRLPFILLFCLFCITYAKPGHDNDNGGGRRKKAQKMGASIKGMHAPRKSIKGHLKFNRKETLTIALSDGETEDIEMEIVDIPKNEEDGEESAIYMGKGRNRGSICRQSCKMNKDSECHQTCLTRNDAGTTYISGDKALRLPQSEDADLIFDTAVRKKNESLSEVNLKLNMINKQTDQRNKRAVGFAETAGIIKVEFYCDDRFMEFFVDFAGSVDDAKHEVISYTTLLMSDISIRYQSLGEHGVTYTKGTSDSELPSVLDLTVHNLAVHSPPLDVNGNFLNYEWSQKNVQGNKVVVRENQQGFLADFRDFISKKVKDNINSGNEHLNKADHYFALTGYDVVVIDNSGTEFSGVIGQLDTCYTITMQECFNNTQNGFNIKMYTNIVPSLIVGFEIQFLPHPIKYPLKPINIKTYYEGFMILTNGDCYRVAWLETMCDLSDIIDGYHTSVNEFGNSMASLLSHEMGHTAGMDHDTISGRYVMSDRLFRPTADVRDTYDKFSLESAQYISSYLSGISDFDPMCLFDESVTLADTHQFCDGTIFSDYSYDDLCHFYVGTEACDNTPPTPVNDCVSKTDFTQDTVRCAFEPGNCNSYYNLDVDAGIACVGDDADDHVCYHGTCQKLSELCPTVPPTVPTVPTVPPTVPTVPTVPPTVPTVPTVPPTVPTVPTVPPTVPTVPTVPPTVPTVPTVPPTVPTVPTVPPTVPTVPTVPPTVPTVPTVPPTVPTVPTVPPTVPTVPTVPPTVPTVPTVPPTVPTVPTTTSSVMNCSEVKRKRKCCATYRINEDKCIEAGCIFKIRKRRNDTVCKIPKTG